MAYSTGNINWLSIKSGYGFITDLNGKEVFFKVENITQTYQRPIKGDRVSFKTRNDSRGTIAIQIDKA